jgi:hypothetical protein
MRQILGNVSSSSNVTEAVAHVRLVAFALVMPYVDHISVLSSNTSSEARSSSLARAADHCKTAFTKHLGEPLVKLTAQERRLKDAMEGVLERICKFGTGVLGDSLALLEPLEDATRESEEKGRQMLTTWGDEVEQLMNWLGWAMWQRCPRACSWDVRFVFRASNRWRGTEMIGAQEQCFMPMWPIIRPPHYDPGGPDGGPPPKTEEFVPRCVKMDWFEDFHP